MYHGTTQSFTDIRASRNTHGPTFSPARKSYSRPSLPEPETESNTRPQRKPKRPRLFRASSRLRAPSGSPSHADAVAAALRGAPPPPPEAPRPPPSAVTPRCPPPPPVGGGGGGPTHHHDAASRPPTRPRAAQGRCGAGRGGAGRPI